MADHNKQTSPTWSEIVEAQCIADARRREARRLRKVADDIDEEAARIEVRFGIVPIAKGEIDGLP